MSVSRPDSYGFQVRVKRNGKVLGKYFSLRAHGGVRAAMAAARAYEARLLRIPTAPATEPTVRNRTTGLRGIALAKYRPKGRKITVFEYKVGYLDPNTGLRRVRSFYVGTKVTYNKKRAAAVLRKAVEFRRSMLRRVSRARRRVGSGARAGRR